MCWLECEYVVLSDSRLTGTLLLDIEHDADDRVPNVTGTAVTCLDHCEQLRITNSSHACIAQYSFG